MQIILDLPDNLSTKLNALPNPKQFIVKLLSEFLDSGFWIKPRPVVAATGTENSEKLYCSGYT